MTSRSFKNKFEERCARDLGPAYAYEPIRLPYVIEAHYIPDFVDLVGKRIVEGKGLFDAADRRKIMAVRKANPDWKIEIWFTNPERKISKASKTSYADWCDRHGIAWKRGPCARRMTPPRGQRPIKPTARRQEMSAEQTPAR